MLEPSRTSIMELFRENSSRLLAVKVGLSTSERTVLFALMIALQE